MKTIKIIHCIALVSLLVSLGGCKGLYKDYGSVVPHNEATKAFENAKIDPDLNYYISGSDSFPNALIGLNKAYKLDSDLWKKIEMTPERFRDLVSNMQQRAADVSRSQYGFAILDNTGRQIGIRYSLLDVNTPVKMEDEHTVMIITPPLGTYEKHDRDDKDRERP